MPSTYVHLSGKDVGSAFLKICGLKKEEKQRIEDLSPKKCHRCEKMNRPTGKFCLKFGAPLDLETVMKTEEKRQKMDNIMTILLKDLLKDPEIQTHIEHKLTEMKIETHP